MSQHTAQVHWQRAADENFTAGRYSRRHHWLFDGGATVVASAAPQVVAAPWSDASAVDPEEALVAAVASCHMLWFLSLAAERGLIVDHYDDQATGTLARVAPGRMAITEIVLRPRIAFAVAPSAEEIQSLHEEAHARCFIANSLRAHVRVDSRE